MIVYRCLRGFMCAPLRQHILPGTIVARYENTHRLAVNTFPKEDVDPLENAVEYDDPALVLWFYAKEPEPLGSTVGWFIEVEQRPEEMLFGIMTTGLPVNSHLQVGATTGYVYLENATTGLWHRVRVDGPDGNVYMEIEQTGIVSPT